jgi:hypothetical protein
MSSGGNDVVDGGLEDDLRSFLCDVLETWLMESRLVFLSLSVISSRMMNLSRLDLCCDDDFSESPVVARLERWLCLSSFSFSFSFSLPLSFSFPLSLFLALTLLSGTTWSSESQSSIVIGFGFFESDIVCLSTTLHHAGSYVRWALLAAVEG